MKGSTFYPLSAQIRDTALVHGLRWAASYYAAMGVPAEEFVLLAKGGGVL